MTIGKKIGLFYALPAVMTVGLFERVTGLVAHAVGDQRPVVFDAHC